MSGGFKMKKSTNKNRGLIILLLLCVIVLSALLIIVLTQLAKSQNKSIDSSGNNSIHNNKSSHILNESLNNDTSNTRAEAFLATIGNIKNEGVELRKSFDEYSEMIIPIPKGTTVRVLEKTFLHPNEYNCYLIDYNDKIGYVDVDDVNLTESTCELTDDQLGAVAILRYFEAKETVETYYASLFELDNNIQFTESEYTYTALKDIHSKAEWCNKIHELFSDNERTAEHNIDPIFKKYYIEKDNQVYQSDVIFRKGNLPLDVLRQNLHEVISPIITDKKDNTYSFTLIIFWDKIVSPVDIGKYDSEEVSGTLEFEDSYWKCDDVLIYEPDLTGDDTNENTDSNNIYEGDESNELDEKYQYYNKLKNEYEKETFHFRDDTFSEDDGVGIGIDGKIYCSYNNYIILSYDLDSKTTKEIYKGKWSDWEYINGYFYLIGNTSANNEILKIDSEGNIVNTITLDKRISTILVKEDGTVLVEGGQQGDTKQPGYNFHVIVAPDFSNAVTIPDPYKTIEHGIEKPYEYYNYLSYYDDKLYVNVNAEELIYWYDLNTNEWHNTGYSYGANFLAYQRIGKYFIGRNIYDMENDSFITNMHRAPLYYGGNYSLLIKEGQWLKVRYYDNSTGPYGYEIIGSLGTEMSDTTSNNKDSVIRKINNEYYIFTDAYGVFLRKYESGDASEEVIFQK